MKADEPRVPVAKYGMAIEEAPNIVRRHFQVLDEDAALEGGRIAGDIEMSLALSGSKRTVPTSAPVAAMPALPAPATVKIGTDDLRARLGLG